MEVYDSGKVEKPHACLLLFEDELVCLALPCGAVDSFADVRSNFAAVVSLKENLFRSLVGGFFQHAIHAIRIVAVQGCEMFGQFVVHDAIMVAKV